MNEEFTAIEVRVGSVTATGDYRRDYRFKGRQVGFTKNYDRVRSRYDPGTDKTLTQIGEDRYIIFVEEWTRWQEESDFSYFHSEDPESQRQSVISGRQVADLFPDLANAAGLEFPIEIDLSAEED